MNAPILVHFLFLKTGENLNTVLNSLIQLGDIDYRLDEINKLLGDLPSQVELQQSTIKELTNDIESKSQRLSDLASESAAVQIEIDTTHDKLDKYKKQLFLVTSNKAYDALLNEIDHSNEQLTSLKSKLDSAIKEKESLSEDIKSNEIKILETTELLEENQVELKETQSTTQSELTKLESQRKTVEKRIENQYLNLYNRLKGGRVGVGIVNVNRNACGACYNFLPPQTVIEVKRGEKVITCNSCGVILFWEDIEG